MFHPAQSKQFRYLNPPSRHAAFLFELPEGSYCVIVPRAVGAKTDSLCFNGFQAFLVLQPLTPCQVLGNKGVVCSQRRDTAIKLLGKESLYYQVCELLCVVSGGAGFRTLSWFVHVRPVALPLTEQLENSQRRCAYAPGFLDGALGAPHS